MSGSTLATSLALAAGLAGSIQVSLMSRLGERIGVLEALGFSTLVTGVLAVVLLLIARRSLAGYERAVHQPWWMLLGGVAGLLIVFTVTYAGPRIGVAATVGILIGGQLAMGAAIDRWGLFGSQRIPLHWPRVVGIALLAAGAALSLRSRRAGACRSGGRRQWRMVVAAACSVQAGAAVAKTLFPQLGPAGVVFLRLLFGSAALWAIARPQLRGRAVTDLRLVAALGVVLVSMNLAFYESLDRLPLGVAVTVEFLGPLAVAVLGSRRAVDLLWVGLAAGGVALLADGGGSTVRPLGIVLAAVAGFFWACYILLGVHVGRAFAGSSGLAVAMALGALLVAPWGIVSAGHHLRDAQLVGAGVGVGLLSSALPWSLELEALRRLPARVFSVVLSLEPVVAALAGVVFLHEHLRTRAWVAVVLVVVACAGAAGRHRPSVPPDA